MKYPSLVSTTTRRSLHRYFRTLQHHFHAPTIDPVTPVFDGRTPQPPNNIVVSVYSYCTYNGSDISLLYCGPMI